MKEWKEYRLGDIAQVKGGKRLPKGVNLIKEKNSHPYIRVRDLGQKKVLELDSSYEYVDDKTQKSISRYIVNSGDIIISIVGTIGLVAIIGKTLDKANLTENCVKLININAFNKDFLYYYLVSELGKNEIEKGIVGAVQAKLPIKNIQAITIKAPNLERQSNIAKILKSLDDKIEVNRRINDNLEQQAQALFKSWFVDFEPFKDGEFVESELGMIPKGWRVKSLGELITVIDNRGKTPPLCSDTNYPIIDVKSLSGVGRILNYDNCTKYVSHETYHKWFRNGHPQYYDLLLSTVGSLAEIKIFTGGNGCIAQNVVALRNQDLALFLFDYLNYIKSDLISYNIGSVQPSIKVTHIIKHKILVPSNDILNRYTYCCKAITDLIRNNCKTMNTLSTLRDTLLPKLMSGELNINYKIES